MAAHSLTSRRQLGIRSSGKSIKIVGHAQGWQGSNRHQRGIRNPGTPQTYRERRGILYEDASYRGLAGVRQLMESIRQNFDEFHVEVEEYIDHDEHVVVALHQRATGKASGASVDIHIGQVWTLRDGKAVRWRIYRSKDEALAAVGATG
jgi:ketosteroid isomerase-like protein